MGFLASFLLKFFSSGVLSFVSNIVGKLSDQRIAIVQAQAGLAAGEVTAVIAAEQTRISAQASTIMAAMNHPIWWIGWALFVLPAGCYAALIHSKSLLCPFFVSVCEWNILRVPATTEAWDQLVVLSFFGLAATSSVVGLIASKIGTPK